MSSERTSAQRPFVRCASSSEAPLSALRGVVEDENVVLAEPDVPFLHRGEAVALVLLGVFLRPDPEEAAVEQAHGAGEDTLSGEAFFPLEVLDGDPPHLRKHPREVEHFVELLLVTTKP